MSLAENGDLLVFRSIDDIKTLANVSGISIEEYVNCWTANFSREPEISDDLISKLDELLDP